MWELGNREGEKMRKNEGMGFYLLGDVWIMGGSVDHDVMYVTG
jgi:hypothetical protein